MRVQGRNPSSSFLRSRVQGQSSSTSSLSRLNGLLNSRNIESKDRPNSRFKPVKACDSDYCSNDCQTQCCS